MGRLGLLALALVTLLPQAIGRRFLFGNREASPPLGRDEIVDRAVHKQTALRTAGRCAHEWRRTSSLCPEGATMMMHEDVIVIMGSFSHCQVAGCIHAGQDQGIARDESEVLHAALEKEVARLVIEKPGTSFEQHLRGLRDQYKEDGRLCKTTLAALLEEMSDGESSFTTMRFFAEQATYRGFTGVEVDQSWAALKAHESEQMVLSMTRRASKAATVRARGAFLAVWRNVVINAHRAQQQDGLILALQSQLAIRDAQLEIERSEKALALGAMETLRAEVFELRDQASLARKNAEKEIATLKEELDASYESTREASEREQAAKREGAVKTSRIFELEGLVEDFQTKVAVGRQDLENARAEGSLALSTIEAMEVEIAGVRAEAASAEKVALASAAAFEAELAAADVLRTKVLLRCKSCLADLATEKAANSRLLSAGESLRDELAGAVDAEDAAIMAGRILELEESVADLQTKVAVGRELLEDAQAAGTTALSTIEAKDAEIDEVRAEAASAKQVAAERAAALEAELTAADVRLKKVLVRGKSCLADLATEKAANSRLL